ncbi:MAG: hypothetical protein KY450_06285 [Actinobacteria bacterium]|nr:hypothetical protein [Actinomycetota bacterium]
MSDVRVVAYVPDLLDRSKLRAAAAATFVAAPEQLAGVVAPDDVVVVDLARPGVLEALPALVASGARVIGFGSHVDRATLEAAAATGCEAMPRSQFFRSLGALLSPDAP